MKISNFKFKIALLLNRYIVKKKAMQLCNYSAINRGFTIIELLIVMLILVIVGGLMTSIFVVSLRSTNKSNNLATVRQNGNGAIEQMSRKLRYATKIVGLGNTLPVTTLDSNPGLCSDGSVDLDPSQYYKMISFETENPDPNIDTPILNTFSCNDSDGTIDIDTDAITDKLHTSVQNCSFSCIQQPSGSTVNIYFKMSDKNGGTSTEINENVVTPITFSTSVTLRNTQ